MVALSRPASASEVYSLNAVERLYWDGRRDSSLLEKERTVGRTVIAEANSDGYADAVATFVFGRVQGAVGAMHQGLEALLAPRYGNANREGD